MRRHWQYLKYVLRHKWFVFVAAVGLRVPIWNAVFHDWTKFLPSEWFPYVAYFYGKKEVVPNAWAINLKGESVPVTKAPAHVQEAFDLAWLHHQKRNKHHWQYWLLSPDKPRPNFTMQSHDDGMTHIHIRKVDGGTTVAMVYDDGASWWKRPDYTAEKELERDLDNTPVPLQMPDWARREMLADWIGAGRALGKPNTWEWYGANKDSIFLHPETRAWIEHRLAEMKAYHAQYEKMRGMGIIA